MDTVTSLIGWLIYIIGLPTHLFWPLGDIIKMIYTAVILYAVYRFTPQFVRDAVRKFLWPYIGALARKLRNGLGRLMMDTDTPRGTSDTHTDGVRAPAKRSFKRGIFLRVRWMMIGALFLFAGENWQTVSAYLYKLASP
jgi:TM2 domain-containing membrane protein YozV